MRVMTEAINNHNIDTLVSMAGVQNGVYGAGFLANKFGNLTGLTFFPVCVALFGTFSLVFSDRAVTDLFYTSIFQKELSIANFWYPLSSLRTLFLPFLLPVSFLRHSPLNNEVPYQQHCNFLPFVNNIVPSANSTNFKNNFMRLNKAVFLASPADGLVEPYISELFGFFAMNSETKLVPVQQQAVYVQDTFGLKSMMQAGKVVLKV